MHTTSKFGRISTFALIVGAGLFATAANAQEARTQTSNRSQATAVSELVVTAERRTENLQTTAISATVLDAQALENKGVNGLTTIQFAAPGVMIADYGSANTVNIRGVGQARVDVDLPSGVVIYRDGVPTLTGYFQNAPFYDMASVEVLRGPQGTFGGKSASAGAIFLRTQDPRLGELGGSVMVGAGNKSFLEGTAVVNVPVSETLAVRLAVHVEKRHSLFDSISSNPLPGGQGSAGPFTGNDTRELVSGRIGVLWQPSDQFTAMFKLDLDDLDFGAHITSGLDPRTGALEDIRNPIVNGPHKYVDRGARSSMKLSYEFDNGVTLNSLTGFSTVQTVANWDINGSDPSPLSLRSGGDFTNWSEEINLLSPSDQPLRWVTGVFFQRYLNHYAAPDKDGFGFDITNEPRLDYASPWRKNETSFAVFGQVEYDLTKKLELQVGARWGTYKFDQFTAFQYDPLAFATVDDLNGNGIGTQGPLVLLEGSGFTEELSEHSVDWKVNANYTINDDHFVYALISRGHTPGSINMADPDFFETPQHGTYKEMSVVNYELGWKGAFFDRQIRAQMNAYYQEFKNYQADFALAPGPNVPAGTTLFQFQNAKTKSRIYGVEIGAQARFGNLASDLGFAYSKSKLGDFGEVLNAFAPIYGGPDTIDMDGARTPFAPTVTANAGVEYNFQVAGVGDGLTITPRLDVAYRGSAYSRLFQNPATYLAPVTLWNAQVRFVTGPWSFEIWSTNLFDKKFVGAKQNIEGATPTFTRPFPHINGIIYAGPPRLFGVRLERSF